LRGASQVARVPTEDRHEQDKTSRINLHIGNDCLGCHTCGSDQHGARADDSTSLLKAMADYTAAQKSITANFDSDIEVITPELQKIQFASSGQLRMTRPDKIHIKRTGGYADVDLVYDGKTVSLYGNNAKAYVQADAPGTSTNSSTRSRPRRVPRCRAPICCCPTPSTC
jgi:hypothetical protein